MSQVNKVEMDNNNNIDHSPPTGPSQSSDRHSFLFSFLFSFFLLVCRGAAPIRLLHPVACHAQANACV